jgi:hypothetical protein
VEQVLDLFKRGSSNFFFPWGPLFSGGRGDGPRGQREDLIERRLISHEGPLEQPFSGLPQGGKVNLQKAGDSVIVIKAQSISVRNSHQKKIEKGFQGGKIPQEASCNETMIDPAEGALDLSEPFGIENSFGLHGHYPPVWMILFCSKGIDLAI